MNDVVELVNKFGFPIVAAVGMGYLIYFVYKWATQEIKPVISEANKTLIALIDRIRMLDNDLLRLDQKVSTVLELRGKTIERERIIAEQKINQTVEDKPVSIGKRKSTPKEATNDK
jgi:hypothetical protein